MSELAVMPLIDYKAACDKVREKVDLTTVKFEETDFGYLRSEVFSVPTNGTYIFHYEFSDPSKISYLYCADPEWENNYPPGSFNPVDNNNAQGYVPAVPSRIFIGKQMGMTTKDILKASLSIDGETVVDFITTPTIKSGELADKVDKVYEAGQKAEYDRFWDELQRNGSQTNYLGAFANYTEAIFKPKYDMQPANATNMFYQFKGKDLPELLQKAGVTLDFSKCTEFSNFFLWSTVEHIGVINASNGSHFDINQCRFLHTIDKIIPRSDALQAISFTNASALKNITFEGEINCNFRIQSSPLTLESAKSIISALKDYSGTTDEFKYTVSFSENTKVLLEAEGATAPNGDTWLNYAFAKGWNR